MQLCECGSMLLFCACIPANSVCMLLASECLYGFLYFVQANCCSCFHVVLTAPCWGKAAARCAVVVAGR